MERIRALGFAATSQSPAWCRCTTLTGGAKPGPQLTRRGRVGDGVGTRTVRPTAFSSPSSAVGRLAVAVCRGELTVGCGDHDELGISIVHERLLSGEPPQGRSGKTAVAFWGRWAREMSGPSAPRRGDQQLGLASARRASAWSISENTGQTIWSSPCGRSGEQCDDRRRVGVVRGDLHPDAIAASVGGDRQESATGGLASSEIFDPFG